MAKVVTKGLIGKEDISYGVGTFSRATSTGGTQTMTKIPSSTDVETLTNKTLTSPTITGPTITTPTISSPVITGTPSGAGIKTITSKSGTGAGTYSTASASFVDVDGTNLSYTVTIPTGWKLIVRATGACGQGTAVPGIFIGIYDSVANTTTGTLQILPANTTVTVPFATQRVITGDGVSHTVSLRYATANTSDSAFIQNASANNALPVMICELEPSN